MSHRDPVTGVIYIMEEPPGKCELCGAVEETRPYGPNGEQICFGCGEKNPEITKKKIAEVLFGDGVKGVVIYGKA